MLEHHNLSISLYESLKNDPYFSFMSNNIQGTKEDSIRVMLAYMNYSIQDALKLSLIHI